MRKFFRKDKAEQIRVKRWYGVVLNKGDVLYTMAFDESDAIRRIFGNTDSFAVRRSVHCVVPCKLAVRDDFTFLGK